MWENPVRPSAILLSVLLLAGELVRCQNIGRAEELVRSGDLVGARAELEQATRNEPLNAEAHYRLAMLLLAPVFNGGEDEAKDLIERAVELEPGNAEYHYGMGAVFGVKAQRSGVFRQALLAPRIRKAFLRATELNPRHLPARIALIQYYRMAPGLMGGDRDLAEKHLDTLVRVDRITGRIFRARMLEMDKKFDEAERELKDLAAVDGSSDRVWKGLGSFYLRRGQPDLAMDPLTTYVKLRPDTADAYNSLGEVHLQKADLNRAQPLFEEALRRDSTFVPALMNSGDLHRMKGERDRARHFYRQVLERDRSERRRKEAEQRLKDLN